MKLQDAIEQAEKKAYKENVDHVVGRILKNDWQIARSDDISTLAQMREPRFSVHPDGVDQRHIDHGEIDAMKIEMQNTVVKFAKTPLQRLGLILFAGSIIAFLISFVIWNIYIELSIERFFDSFLSADSYYANQYKSIYFFNKCTFWTLVTGILCYFGIIDKICFGLISKVLRFVVKG